MVDSTNPRVMADNIKMLAAGAGGGTTVEANPEGAATGELEKIGIGDDIYSVGGKIVYSKTEHEVGTWTDGSPIYERTFELETAVTYGTSWTKTGISATGIDKLIDVKTWELPTAVEKYDAWVRVLDGEIAIMTWRANTSAKMISLQYTKTVTP